jgi:hypothetical protein
MTSFIHFEQLWLVTWSSNPDMSNSGGRDITARPLVKAWSAMGFDLDHEGWLAHLSRYRGLWPRRSHAWQRLFWLRPCLRCRHQDDCCNHRDTTLPRSGARQGRRSVFRACSWSIDPLQSPHEVPRRCGVQRSDATSSACRFDKTRAIHTRIKTTRAQPAFSAARPH